MRGASLYPKKKEVIIISEDKGELQKCISKSSEELFDSLCHSTEKFNVRQRIWARRFIRIDACEAYK